MQTPIHVYATFDLETTGLNESKHAIAEIAVCPFDKDLNDLPEYESGIIKPYDDREIEPKALECNGITRDQLSKGRDSKEVLDEFCKYLKKLSKTPSKIILVGHNIDKFDIPHLVDYFKTHKKDLSKFVNLNLSIDTMWWGRIKWTESTNYKLGTCCENLGIELIDAHRAINDTRANKMLAKDFIKSLRSGSEKEKGEEYKRPRFQY